MYWYPFSEPEEEQAFAQAEAQAKEVDAGDSDTRKHIGNLGEIAVSAFFNQFADEHHWKYLNAETMEEKETEFRKSDFRFGGLEVDVKTATDIRKFDPAYMIAMEEDRPTASDYPRINAEDSSDVYVFVLISEGRESLPNWSERNLSVLSDGWEKERSGEYVAAILGWMYVEEAVRAFAGSQNIDLGKFTRMSGRDMYGLLLQSGVPSNESIL